MQEQVTFYRSYGFRDQDGWRIPLRAWVHERSVLAAVTGRLSAALGISDAGEIATFQHRFRDFVADSESREDLTLRFDHDDVDRRIIDAGGRASRTDLNGLMAGSVTLTDVEARTLLERQGSTHGWLSFRASSAGHDGIGHVQLIPPTGVSVVSDIDDTIKETHIPAGSREVLLNTFFRPFAASAGMAEMYRAFENAAFHYVSGGPFQLYGPLAEFLLADAAGFPAGSFHMKVIPKHLLSLSTWESIERLLINPDATVDHKVSEDLHVDAAFSRTPVRTGRRFRREGPRGVSHGSRDLRAAGARNPYPRRDRRAEREPSAPGGDDRHPSADHTTQTVMTEPGGSMPTLMTDAELEAAMTSAEEVDSFEFRNEKDQDDFILATLFKDRVGHFRVVTMSGTNSIFNGAGNIAERLTADEVKTWTRFK